ncbi:helix-turn-helix domain-containing protein [Caulobacter segnis]|uniref:Transcriptional regulator n=1 Tax=Caulobacter segnis TaxID=88688 RepID=A0A2W5VBD4_9CAUL|nr:helix-turn-helix transcriptional regulator [Caulobacter segnis]PZR37209.1 MAG: transcriptional regulator [Caulobacter segnis]
MSDQEDHTPHFIDVHVGARIRMRRKMLNVSQQKLADAVGKTFQQIQKYENGANRVSCSVLYLFARELHTDVGFFFDGLPAADQDLDVAAEVDQVTLMMANNGGPELARLYVDLDPAQRASVLNVVKAIHDATAITRIAA